MLTYFENFETISKMASIATIGSSANTLSTTTTTTTSNSNITPTHSTNGNPLRKLVGKLVFLDLNNSYKLMNKVKDCLNLIDAKIADCLSKEVDFVITNRDTSSVNESTTATTNTTNPNTDIQNNESSKKVKTSPNALNLSSRTSSLINRTQTILGKAKSYASFDILTTARRLDIKVININEIERYIEKCVQKKKSLESNEIVGLNSTCNLTANANNENSNLLLCNKGSFLNSPLKLNSTTPQNNGVIHNPSIQSALIASTNANSSASAQFQPFIKKNYEKLSINSTNHKIYKLKSPFLKFESVCKQYKPIYQEFKIWHEINLDSSVSLKNSKNSPFCIYFSDEIKNSSTNGNESDAGENENGGNMLGKTPSSKKNKLPNENDAQLQNKSLFKSPTSSTLITSNHNSNNNNSKSNSNLVGKFNGNTTNSNNINNKTNLVPNPITQNKKKPTGYCECCKQRYENLKQHLTSAQHETFEKNQSNFKELDEFINGSLNFQNFLVKNNLNMAPQKIINEDQNEEMVSNENFNLDEIKEFAKIFKKSRQALGFSQAQVIDAIGTELKETAICTESTISRFERLDITPRSGAKIRPVLEKWLNNTELKFGNRIKTVGEQYSTEQTLNELSKKRKRLVTFTPHALDILNEAFKKNTHPSSEELELISIRLNMDIELIRVWFSDKQKSFNKIKKFKQGNLVNSLAINLNSSLTENDTSMSSQCSPHCTPNQSILNGRKSIGNNRHLILGVTQNSINTPNKTNQFTNIQNHHQKNVFKNTPSKASSLSLSSPSAAVLFNLNSNSFSMMHENLNTTIPSVHNSATKLLASKVELINGNTELQSIITSGSKFQEERNSILRDENSTDLSCLEEITAAFAYDFSYEIVQK